MLETFSELLHVYHQYLISGIFISVLFIMLVKSLGKGRIVTGLSTQVVRWVILVYAFLALGDLLLNGYRLPTIQGPFIWLFHLIPLFKSVLPLCLLINRLRANLYVLLIVSVLMNFAWLFESFIIHVTSLHRDYTSVTWLYFLPNSREQMILFRGLFLGVFSVLLEWSVRKLNLFINTADD